jgi:hypothetical protein
MAKINYPFQILLVVIGTKGQATRRDPTGHFNTNSLSKNQAHA